MKTTVILDELGASHDLTANFGLDDKLVVHYLSNVFLYKKAKSDGLLITYLKVTSNKGFYVKRPISGVIEFNYNKKTLSYEIGTDISDGEYIDILGLFEIETNY